MILEDSQLLIDDAKKLLDEIKSIYDRDINKGDGSPLLKIRIKQFLDNINSSLDYAAFYIFNEYCANRLNRLKEEQPRKFNRLERSIYFPCKTKLNGNGGFNQYISTTFPYLEEEKPEIINIFKKYQPFPTQSKWLSHLKELVNSNKHRELSKQPYGQIMKINQLKLPGDIYIRNANLIGYGSAPLITFEGGTAQPIYFDGSLDSGLIFTELGEPVLKVLNRISRSAPSIISDLENCL